MSAPDLQKQKVQRPRKRRSGLQYRSFNKHELVRMAYLAGQDYSAGQVAEMMGNTTGGRVRAMMRGYGIHFARRGDDDFLKLKWSARDTAALEQIAGDRAYGPHDIAVIALRILISEPTLFGNLLDEAEQIEAARK